MKRAYEVIVMENCEARFGPSDYLHGYHNAKFFEHKKDADEYAKKHTNTFSKVVVREIEIL